MPLAFSKWSPHGFLEWKVIEFQPGLDGSKPYSAGALLTFDSEEGFQKAMACEGTSEVVGDVGNFSKVQPVMLVGKVAGTSGGTAS